MIEVNQNIKLFNEIYVIEDEYLSFIMLTFDNLNLKKVIAPNFMNTKSNNQKLIPSSNSAEMPLSTNEMIPGPKTPIKRLPSEHHSIYSKLSPLHMPLKIQARTLDPPYNSHPEMRLLETPISK